MAEPSNMQVVFMGMITVFICLVILIAMITVMSKIIRIFAQKQEAGNTAASIPEKTDCQGSGLERQMLVAAISTAIAEMSGADISKIRIHSITPIDK